jgi:hypothetical protein
LCQSAELAAQSVDYAVVAVAVDDEDGMDRRRGGPTSPSERRGGHDWPYLSGHGKRNVGCPGGLAGPSLEDEGKGDGIVTDMASQHRSSPRLRLTALAALLIGAGAAGCSSAGTKTEVKGVVISKDDPDLGGPNAAVSEFRAGERSSYGS